MVESRENTESAELAKGAFSLARSLGIRKLLVQADLLRDVRLVEKERDKERVIWLTRGSIELPLVKSIHSVVTIPVTAELSRMSQITMGLFLAVLNGYLEPDESVICLSGVAGKERLDTLLIANPRRDFPWFHNYDVEETRSLFATREVARIVEICVRFSAEGREGKPVGTTFVVGEPEQLAPYLRQLILNPCEGHPKNRRNVHRPECLETIREFSALDGAFIVNKKGVVESAGTYLAAPATKVKLRSGLGARHAAAAAITAITDAIAVVVSESSGCVTVFHEGTSILELERPEPTPQRVEPASE